MDQPLDLCITLTRPSEGSPPGIIASVEVRCDLLSLHDKGNPLKDPLTQQERNDLRWYLEEYWKWPYEGFTERSKEVEALLVEVGKRLYELLRLSPGAKDVVEAWWRHPETQRFIIVESDVPRVLSLPWELLHDEHGFLAHDTSVRPSIPIVRRLPQREVVALEASFEPPLRVLLITARPYDVGFVDPRSIARELLDEVQGQVEARAVALEFLRPPTLSALRARLSDRSRPRVHVLHFDGHGMFEEKISGQGVLAFEDDAGRLRLVTASEIAELLGQASVRMVILTACQSATLAQDDALGSVAIQLLRHGIDAVVAMSANVLVASAVHYTESLYQALAAGMSIEAAQGKARMALYNDPYRHPYRRRSDEEGRPVEMQDWWLPHFYQQNLLTLHLTEPVSSDAQKRLSPPSLKEDMPAEPRYGFVGRARELLQIERALLRHRLVVIHGFGGVGKTALAREAADWLTRTKMFDGACFISFEHGGDSELLMSELGTFAGINDGLYRPNDSKAALQRLIPVLESQRVLVIADNLETILPEGDAPLEAGARAELWDVLLSLTRMGAGVLLTSRNKAIDDRQLISGSLVVYLELGGLEPEDAYALASHLLNELAIDPACAPYAGLRDLLTQLDHHPLAIQLVLPVLKNVSLARIQVDFAKLLPVFADDTETGRNQSLLASLNYSVQRLSEEQRSLLARLALFEGGAYEERLLKITEIPRSEWLKLRQVLEQAALITLERVHKNIRYPFLHFHPLLQPFLQEQIGISDTRLRRRYISGYYSFADYVHQKDDHYPQPIRALVRKELPNLRRTLEILLQENMMSEASFMNACIERFLTIFGLSRERESLQRRFSEAVTAHVSGSPALSELEYAHEMGLILDDKSKGDLSAAVTRLNSLLKRIETQPEGKKPQRGSYEHCIVLHSLAECFTDMGRPTAAEERLRQAISIIDTLIRQEPHQQAFLGERGTLLCELGYALSEQGLYAQAQESYEDALTAFTNIEHVGGQAMVLGGFGNLAQNQKDYARARSYYKQALKRFQMLEERASESMMWHQLGMVAQLQGDLAEAELSYRQSLILREQQNDAGGVATTCNQLATLAYQAGRPSEAEAWYRRALEIVTQLQPGSSLHAICLNNLAILLKQKRQKEALSEAHHYSEQALAIAEGLEVPDLTSRIRSTLAEISDLENKA